MNNLLIEREWQVQGNWYAPRKFLMENFKSVVHIEYINQSSSAGEWQGLFIQEINGWSYVIPFEQDNNWPGGDGFTLTTGEVFTKTKQPSSQIIMNEAMEMFYEIYYT